MAGALENLAAYLPRWTAQVRTDGGVRDPLGLSGHAHALTDELLPGITTQTWWARYYAIYCWILWHIGEVERPTSEAADNLAFRRREAAFALGSQLSGNRYHGIEATTEQLDKSADLVSLDYYVLSATPYGAFGAHYAGSMHALGLFERNTPIRAEATPGIATKLALAVDATLRSTPFYSKRLWERPSAAKSDLEASGPRLGLAAIRSPECAEERRLLVDLMFGFDCKGDIRRRPHSLGLLLWTIEQYARAGLACPVKQPETSLLYLPHYFGTLAADNDVTAAIPAVPPAFAACAAGWQQFCAHQYWTAALERLFEALLRTLAERPGGASAREVADAWIDGGLIDGVCERTGRDAEMPAALTTPPDPSQLVPGEPLSETDLCAPTEDAADEACTALLVIASLHARWFAGPGTRARSPAEHLRSQVVPIVEHWRDPGLSWSQALVDLIERQLLRRHDQTLDSKRRPSSPWIGRNGDRLVHRQDARVEFRNARIAPALHILQDLLLVESVRAKASKERLVLTTDGRALLARMTGPGL